MPVKPTEREEEYFARTEFERLKKIEEEKHKKLARNKEAIAGSPLYAVPEMRYGTGGD